MKVSLLHRATINENGRRKWSDKKERKMKDGDNYIIALPVTAFLPAVAAFNKLLDLEFAVTIVSRCFLFFPGTITDWNLIPSTIRAGSHSSFLSYLNYNLKFFAKFFFFLFLFSFISFRCKSVKEYA